MSASKTVLNKAMLFTVKRHELIKELPHDIVNVTESEKDTVFDAFDRVQKMHGTTADLFSAYTDTVYQINRNRRLSVSSPPAADTISQFEYDEVVRANRVLESEIKRLKARESELEGQIKAAADTLKPKADGAMASNVKTLFMYQYLLQMLSALGLSVSVYGLYVELMMESDPNYVPLCDISALFSCSKALDSPFGRGLGLVGEILGEEHPLNQRNVVYGIVVYVLFIFLSMSSRMTAATIQLLAAMGLNMMTIYLATLLYHLGTVCVVCVSVYAINLLLLPVAFARCNALRQVNNKKRM